MNTTRIEGITWTVVDRNRRICRVAGRDFMAVRETGDWLVSEIADGRVYVLAEDIEAADLSGFVYDVLMGAEPGPESTTGLSPEERRSWVELYASASGRRLAGTRTRP